ncbi:hypothetical protein ACO0LM_13130 [Undibacterium sp. Di26W]|uniref:hypothetical protein n=1 Tax=Undibacterium sp. Di26W TaxID=3413035 RepID=UPI003BF3EC44
MIWSKWMPGPAVMATGKLLVSFTDFKVNRFLDLPQAALAGFDLRRGWADMDGAVGMWLWFMPTQKRCGSLTVWTDEVSLRQFVRSPEHMVIVKAYRNRGSMNSSTWEVDSRTRRLTIRSDALQHLQPA